MCGRVIVDYEENMRVPSSLDIAKWMSSIPEGAISSWNIPPTEPVPVVLTSPKDGTKRFEVAHWGIIPEWSKDGKARNTHNAIYDEVFDKPTFAPLVKTQRCVLPVTGFYEWTGPKNDRTPHAIFGPEQVLPLAGLYGWWRSPKGEWKLTATVLTCPAAGVMSDLHHRMPVFMPKELLRTWLDPKVVGDQALLELAAALSVPYSERLREYAVRPLKDDGKHLIDPL